MPRQHRHVVEEPLGRRVRLAQIELHRLLIQLAHRNRLAADGEQVPVRRRDLLVEVHPKREHHIVGVERVTVGELDPAPQSHACTGGRPARPSRTSPAPAPVRCVSRLMWIRSACIRRRTSLDGAVDRGDGVERSRLGALHDDELAAGAARFRLGDEKIRGGRRPLHSRDGRGRRPRRAGEERRAIRQTACSSIGPTPGERSHSFSASRLWRADGGHQPTRSTAETPGSTQFQGGTSTSKTPAHDIG